MSMNEASRIKFEAEAENEKAYRAALAEQGLTPAEPPGPIVPLDDNDTGRMSVPDEVAEKEYEAERKYQYELELAGLPDEEREEKMREWRIRRRQRVLLGTWSEMMGSEPPHASFARDADGNLYLIERQPDVISTRDITARGCWSGYNKGTTPARYQYGYLLPRGTLAGRRQIRYPAREVSIHRSGGRCSRGPAVP